MFEYEIKGITLTMAEMYEISEDNAFSLACNVLLLMDKYGYTEVEAITEVMEASK